MNVLITSVGRRAYMVKYFRDALGNNGLIHVCNSDENTVSFCYADRCVVSPLIYDDSYVPFLLRYCKDNDIDILLSLFDIDLPILSRHKDEFLRIGTNVIVSDEAFVSVCNDKWQTYTFLKDHGFNVPQTYKKLSDVLAALENDEISYPIVVKPRFGCGSIGMAFAEDREELLYLNRRTIKQIKNSYLSFESHGVSNLVIFQEKLRGQEYGVDIINDLNGTFQNAVIKKKIAMRAGETDIAELVENTTIFCEAERLGRVTGHIANLDCDVFLVNGKAYFLEMNARFGGGYPFSHTCGCDLPKAILLWAEQQHVDEKLLTAKPCGAIYKELVLTPMKK